MENQPTAFEKIEEKIDRIENRVSGMRTEFRSMLNTICGEIEELEIQVGVGQKRTQRWIRGILFAACGAGIAVIGLELASRFLDGQNQRSTKSKKT